MGKTTISALLAQGLAAAGRRTLVVDCDPNPTLAESFDLDSSALERFSHDGLRRAGETLALSREPVLVEIEPSLWLLGGPPTGTPAADAVSRGVAGVLLADRFDDVVTDLGAGPELARAAVGGILNPADLCVVLTDGTPNADATAELIEAGCRLRGVAALTVLNERGRPERVAEMLVERLAG